ncbi:hypothetical protein GCM10010232_49090 [Streptomyces amakusaensis]|uniref:Uncharacterized protein n=1 Tax=Streptomyces amakusaensis TaxID=67271 RepID=A0ABW0AME1_9ACTN
MTPTRSGAAALDTLYRALDPETRHVYRILGVLPCPWTDSDLTAAACGLSAGTATWTLEVLAEQGLIEEALQEAGGRAARYRAGGIAHDHAGRLCTGEDVVPPLRRLAHWALLTGRATGPRRQTGPGPAGHGAAWWLPAEFRDDPAAWAGPGKGWFSCRR